MPNDLQSILTTLLNIKIKSLKPIDGGDISEAYLIETETNRFFCKCNSSPNAMNMFRKEAEGLAEISKTKTIATPDVILTNEVDELAFLVLEHIESKTGNSTEMRSFGSQLAALHKFTAPEFGWHQPNYIGSLEQSNHRHSNWATFYWQERILAQLALSIKNGYYKQEDIPKTANAVKVLKTVLGELRPSLLHGDLWGGNYLISTNGQPYLIDPAVYFGHNLVDISMSQLFGGFSSGFYNAYFDHFPKPTKAQIELYQLYYLLVHLNIFGSSYFLQVNQIMKYYF